MRSLLKYAMFLIDKLYKYANRKQSYYTHILFKMCFYKDYANKIGLLLFFFQNFKLSVVLFLLKPEARMFN